MSSVTISGAAEGLNGLLSVTGYGSIAVRVEKIRYGVEIYSEQADSANGKAYYPGWLQDSDFSLDIVHPTVGNRDAFNKWMRVYMTKATSGSLSHGAVLVRVPGRKFARNAIPQGTLNYGDSIDQNARAYRTTMVFRGATNPLSTGSASSFRKAKSDAASSAPFYPSTGQKKGAESLAATIFDETDHALISHLLGYSPPLPPHQNAGLA